MLSSMSIGAIAAAESGPTLLRAAAAAAPLASSFARSFLRFGSSSADLSEEAPSAKQAEVSDCI